MVIEKTFISLKIIFNNCRFHIYFIAWNFKQWITNLSYFFKIITLTMYCNKIWRFMKIFNFLLVYCDSNDVKVFCMYFLKLPVYCGIDHVKLFLCIIKGYWRFQTVYLETRIPPPFESVDPSYHLLSLQSFFWFRRLFLMPSPLAA